MLQQFWDGVSNVPILRFGTFELDTDAEQLRKEGRVVRLPPQPFKLLRLLVDAGGRVITREEIRAALWPDDTFVDYEQGVNFAIRQVRDALGDNADRPLYIQTLPKRGYRFLAPVQPPLGPGHHGTAVDLELHKALWANVAELRLGHENRRRREKLLITALAGVAVALVAALLVLWLRR